MQNNKPNSVLLRQFSQWLLLFSIIFSVGCQPRYTQTGGGRTYSNDEIGRIEYNWGQNGFINRNRVRSGALVYSGDRVSTEEATSISVFFRDGGFLQLDANTDPDFRKWFEMGRCIIKAFIQFGQVHVETGSSCDLLIDDKHLAALAHTKFNLEVRPNLSILSVIEGEMVIKRPQPKRVRGHQQLTVFEDGHMEIKPLSLREINEIQHWRKPFDDEMGWCCVDKRVFQATASDCRRNRGDFSHDFRKLKQACQIRQVPKGYCCINGEVHWETESACTQSSGRFFVDERTAHRYCLQAEPDEGWCCRNGELFQASLPECRDQHGRFNRDFRKAQNACRPTEPAQGFCCLTGKVLKQNQPACIQRGGRFFYDKKQAIENCQPPPTEGWCCRDGHLFQTSPYECQKRKGVFNHEYRVAKNTCKPAEPIQGYCCFNGEVSKQDQTVCLRRGGQFYNNPRIAKANCEASKKGWCCKNGNVFSSNLEHCSRIQGQFSINEMKLRRECRPMLKIDPKLIKPPAKIVPIDPNVIRQIPVIK